MRRMPGHALCALSALALLALACRGARAEIYKLDHVAVPEAKTLQTLHAFYVYSHEEAPGRSMGEPFVKFHSLVTHALSKPDSELHNYEGVQLSILPYKDLWKLIDPSNFCSTADDVSRHLAWKQGQLLVQKNATTTYSDLNMYVHTVRFSPHPQDVQVPVLQTGAYMLVYSNCGDFSQATVSGSVIVNNSYGLLPGNEYHKMPFYGWLSLLYVMMAFVWMGLSVRWWRELLQIQYCIAAVIFLGLVEAFLWWMLFNDWNHTGIRGMLLCTVATLSSVAKSASSLVLALAASLGWGVTRPYLDRGTKAKVLALSFLYIVLDFVREAVSSFQHSHSLSFAVVLLCSLPVGLLNGALVYWILTALSSLIETLQERQEVEKLVLFERLWTIYLFALSVALFMLLLQVFDLSQSINIRWHNHWFFADGASHALFVLVLAAMMYLWAPHTNSQKYTYLHQVSQEGQELAGTSTAQAACADEDGLDADEDKPLCTLKVHAVPADKIGVSDGSDVPTTAATE